MSVKLAEYQKFDVAVLPQTANNSTATVYDYYSMEDYRDACIVATIGAMAASKTFTVKALEAEDEDGTGAAAITDATATVTANAEVISMTATFVASTAGSEYTITRHTADGDLSYAFTAHSSTTTVANREFSVGGSSDSDDVVEYLSVLNDETYGVPNWTFTGNSSGVITATCDNPGAETITWASTETTVTFATLAALAYVELNDYDLSSSCKYIGARVETTANSVVQATLLRGMPRREVHQGSAGASASV